MPYIASAGSQCRKNQARPPIQQDTSIYTHSLDTSASAPHPFTPSLIDSRPHQMQHPPFRSPPHDLTTHNPPSHHSTPAHLPPRIPIPYNHPSSSSSLASRASLSALNLLNRCASAESKLTGLLAPPPTGYEPGRPGSLWRASLLRRRRCRAAASTASSSLTGGRRGECGGDGGS